MTMQFKLYMSFGLFFLFIFFIYIHLEDFEKTEPSYTLLKILPKPYMTKATISCLY